MASKMELYERRLDSLKLHSRGVKPSIWTKELSQLYKVSPETIWRDWHRKDTWLPIILDLENREAVRNECIQENKQVKAAAWSLFHNAENDTAKACALKIVLDVNDKLLELSGYSQSVKMELMQTEPFKIEMWRPESAKTTSKE